MAGIFGPSGPRPKAGTSSGNGKMLRISVQQLANIPYSDIRLGPLRLSEWNSRLIDFFHAQVQSNPVIGKHFSSLIQIMLGRSIGKDYLDKQIKMDISNKFINDFIAAVARQCSEENADKWAIMFLKLKALSLQVIANQWEQLPSDVQIAKANEHLYQFAKDSGLPYKVIVY